MMCFPFFCDISTTLLQIVPDIARIPGGTGLWGAQKCANCGSLSEPNVATKNSKERCKVRGASRHGKWRHWLGWPTICSAGTHSVGNHVVCEVLPPSPRMMLSIVTENFHETHVDPVQFLQQAVQRGMYYSFFQSLGAQWRPNTHRGTKIDRRSIKKWQWLHDRHSRHDCWSIKKWQWLHDRLHNFWW